MDYERLVDEHDRIDALSCHIMDLAQSDEPRAEEAAVSLRDLAMLVVDHLLAEDTMIYPTFLKTRDGGKGDAALGMVADLETLKDDWMQYLGDWTPECIAADWQGFREESLTMLSRLRDRVRHETSLLYPMALQHGIIKLRKPRRAAG